MFSVALRASLLRKAAVERLFSGTELFAYRLFYFYGTSSFLVAGNGANIATARSVNSVSGSR